MNQFSSYFKLLVLILFTSNVYAQVSSPFVTCPNANVAIVRGGTNSYANEPVSFYNINPGTGASTLIPGGPLKDPAAPANNMDINAMGLNTADGYLYGMNPGITTTPKFYRMGSNYSVEQVGVIPAPAATLPSMGIVNSAAGEFDQSGNYYFTAVIGTVTFVPASFTPGTFYIGKLANVAGLPAGSSTLSPVYTALNFGSAACGEYLTTLQNAITVSTAQNTGLRDLAYNAKDGKLYTYVSFEYPTGSGTFKGQLLSVDPASGTVTCFTSSVLPFANTSNEVAGVSIAFNGDLEVLFTDGAMYKADAAGVGIYTGGISLLNAASVPGPLRGDLASCGAAAAAPTPVKFEAFTVLENQCSVNFKWTISQEINVNHYELEIQNANGNFVSAGNVNALNSIASHSYNLQVPVEGKYMTGRIKSVDNDGKQSYSNAISIATKCSESSRIAVLNNNQVSGNLQVKWSNISKTGQYVVTVFNATGAAVVKQAVIINAGQSISNIDIQKLAAGTYIFIAQNNTGEKFTTSFVKK